MLSHCLLSGGADITLRAYGEAISHKLYTHVKMSIIGVPVPQSIQCGNKKSGEKGKTHHYVLTCSKSLGFVSHGI